MGIYGLQSCNRPGRRLKVGGLKPEIDATTFLITEATHTLDKNGGFVPDLKCETAPDNM